MIQTSNKYTRINKTRARKLFDQGLTIHLVPCKVLCNYGNMWVIPIPIEKSWYEDFDRAVNNFVYYNCQHTELGLYPAYYID